MSTATDRFGQALGLWHIDCGGEKFDIKLQMGDGRKLRTILFENIKNKTTLFNLFEDFMVELIKRQYPESNMENVKLYVEFNIMELFEKAQLMFRFTTEEELKKAKEETKEEVKKLIEAN